MSKRTVKENELDAEWGAGSMLKKDERFQTDAEWHADLLENIGDNQQNILNELESINENIARLINFYEQEQIKKDKRLINVCYCLCIFGLIFLFVSFF